MRTRLIVPTPETVRSRAERWLDVERAAVVEITSEEKGYPVESAFVSGEMRGWRAAEPGPQTIRLIFDQPQKLKQISLVFEEKENSGTSALLRQYARSRNIKSSFQIPRTQEFVLSWSSDGGSSFREIVRQHVTVLELTIVPNTSGGTACWKSMTRNGLIRRISDD